MNWAAVFYTLTIWMLLASFWQMYRPLDEFAFHRDVALRVFRDIAPAILLAVLLGMML